jgi:hypothetical protein
MERRSRAPRSDEPGHPPDAAAGGGLVRRSLLIGVPTTVALAALPSPVARAASGEDYVTQGLNGVVAYVVPGEDGYSRQQGLTAPYPGGVAAGAGRALAHTYDQAVEVAIAPALAINLPGAQGVSLLLALFTAWRYPSASGPFDHPFANLRHAQKGAVLADLDRQEFWQATPLGYALGTLVTLAAFCSFAEAGVYDRARGSLARWPVGWTLARYRGVSDGWPELLGYWQGRTSVSDPGVAHRSGVDDA